MIQKIDAADRYYTDMGWLKTYWLFSFSNYYDPLNVNHGNLRVFNDDVVEAHGRFGEHPHEEMEIISIILDGEMEHEDTMGNRTIIRPGDVQRMTAGTGIYHSEANNSDKPVHFYQIWIYPETKGLQPSYDQKSFTPELWHNTLALLAANTQQEGIVTLNTDGALYRAALEGDTSVGHTTKGQRNVFIYIIDGAVVINTIGFNRNDQARISAEREIDIQATADAEILLIDVPAMYS